MMAWTNHQCLSRTGDIGSSSSSSCCRRRRCCKHLRNCWLYQWFECDNSSSRLLLVVINCWQWSDNWDLLMHIVVVVWDRCCPRRRRSRHLDRLRSNHYCRYDTATTARWYPLLYIYIYIIKTTLYDLHYCYVDGRILTNEINILNLWMKESSESNTFRSSSCWFSALALLLMLFGLTKIVGLCSMLNSPICCPLVLPPLLRLYKTQHPS